MNARERANILLVDDQPGKLLSLEAILQELDENVVKANSADEALKQLLQTEFAVVLVDVCMPRMDGFELAELIRGHPRFRRTAIIFISAVHLSEADRMKGYDLGAVDYIQVPIIPEILRAKVAVFADLYRKTKELERLNAELERRVAERTADLEASTERLRLAAEAANFGVYEFEPKTGERHWSSKMRELLGMPEDGPISQKQAESVIHPEDLEEVRAIFARVLEPETPSDAGGGEFAVEYRVVVGGGRVCWVLNKGRAIYVDEVGPSGRPVRRAVRVLGTVLDVTERKRAEELKGAMAAIVESSQDAIIGKTLDGIVTTWNAGATALFGYTAEEIVGTPVSRIIPPELREQDEMVTARLRLGERVEPFETVRVAKNGRRIDVSLSVSPLRDAKGRIVGASKVSRDITERRRAEAILARDRAMLEQLVLERTAELREASERLRLADRMATIGTLSAGLGHDMGNLLLPVRMRLDTIERHTLPEEVRSDLAAIRTATQYLQRLARSLRLLAIDSHEEPTDRAMTSVWTWWREVDSVMRNGLPRSVELKARIPTDLPPVRIGEAALTQIVFNLVQNAGHAVAARPELQNAGGAPGTGDGRVEVAAEAVEGHLRLSVIDNGVGMSEEVQRRCLEPFFTTRTRELGTGLGMTLVTGLVRRAGGGLEIQSRAGDGTTITVVLPTAVGTTAGGDPAKGDTQAADTPGGGGVRRVALVALKDLRLMAHVNSVLSSLSIDVRAAETGARPDDAEIWITDDAGMGPGGTREELRRFAGRGRQVIVMAAAEGKDVGAGVVAIDPALKPSVLRARLQEVLTGSEEPAAAEPVVVTPTVTLMARTRVSMARAEAGSGEGAGGGGDRTGAGAGGGET